MPKEGQRLYVVDLPNTAEYGGRVDKSIHFGWFASKEHALSTVLSRYDCLFLYEELAESIDDIVTDDPTEIKRYSGLVRQEKRSREEGQGIAEEAADMIYNAPAPEIPEDSDNPDMKDIFRMAREGVKRERKRQYLAEDKLEQVEQLSLF